MTPRLQEAIDWLGQNQGSMLEELVTLCNINSSSDNFDGLLKVADHLEYLMSDFQIHCQRHSLEPRRWTDDNGTPKEEATGPALEWSSKGGTGKRILLAIHYDTVYPLGHVLQSCTPLENGRLRGPGVIDAKGGIIVLRWAVLAGLKFGLLDGIRWSIILNPDEEVGSASSAPLWKKIAPDYDFGMLFEPSMADGSLVSSRKGSGNFLWMIQGRSAHSGRNFDAGRNAVVRAARLATEIDGLNGKIDGVTFNVGRIQGGGPLNVVPDRCALRVNIRVEDQKQMEWVESQLQQIQDSISEQGTDYRCLLEGGFTSPPKILDETTSLWMREIEMAAELVGQKIQWKASGGASDGNKLSALGLANIDTFGPDGDCLHSPDEWIQISSLPKKASLTLSTLFRQGVGP